MNLPVKIIALPAIIAVFTLALGLITKRSLEQIGDNTAAITDILAKEANQTTSLIQNILERDKVVQLYLQTGDEALIKRFGGLTAKSKGIVSRLRAIGQDPARQARLDQLVALDNGFIAAFNSGVVPNTQKQKQLTEDLLQNKGPFIEKKLTDLIGTAFANQANAAANSGGAALKEFLLAQLYLFKYLADNNDTDAERTRLQLLAAKNGLYQLGDALQDNRRQAWHQQATATLQSYTQAVEGIISAIQTRNQTLNRVLLVNGPQVVAGTNQLEAAVWADLHAKADQVNSVISSTGTTVISLTLVAVLLGLMLAVVVSRAITGSLNQVTKMAQELTAGHLDQQPLDIHSKDEIGQLAQAFNTMLKNLSHFVRQAQNLAAGQLNADKVLAKMEAGTSFERAAQEAALERKQAEGDLAEANAILVGELSKLTVQAITIAEGRLEDPVLAVQISGELGGAFRQMVRRQQFLAEQAKYIANDDLYNQNLKDQGNGTLGEAMARMVRKLRQSQQDLKVRTAKAESQGQQAQQMTHKVGQTSESLAAAARQLAVSTDQLAGSSGKQEKIVENTAAAIQQMAASAHNVAGNTDQLTQQVTENVAALNQLAASITSVTQNTGQMNQRVITNASAIAELAASIQAQAQAADQANQTAKEAAHSAEEGAQIVHQTIAGMEKIAGRVRASTATIGELGKSSEQISTIVSVINDIADQTNLLALNAAIEAARAGDQGRGFAVVADEVRKLAERTSQATQEIDGMIGEIQNKTQQVVDSMEAGMKEVEEGTQQASRSGEALLEIGQGVEQVHGLIAQLSASTAEQASTSDDIVVSTNELNELVQKVTAAMSEQAQSVDVVSQSSQEMQQVVGQVAHSIQEQSTTTEHIAHSMEEVNHITQESLASVQEMNRATQHLATQADGLKDLTADTDGQPAGANGYGEGVLEPAQP